MISSSLFSFGTNLLSPLLLSPPPAMDTASCVSLAGVFSPGTVGLGDGEVVNFFGQINNLNY